MSSLADIVDTLVKENDHRTFINASNVLITFVNNILKNPSEAKYRKIHIANDHVQSKLLSVVGGMECLFLMGFEESEDGEFLVLPQEASLQPLTEIRDSLMQESSKINSPVQTPQPQTRQYIQASQRLMQPPHQSEATFASRIRDGMSRVLQYENLRVQQKAISVIPCDKFQAEAKEEFDIAKAKGELTLDIEDFKLLALLKWFKFSFFKWVNTLPCRQCGGATKNGGSAVPTSEEKMWGAGRVEAHVCDKCNITTRFPRYTNPEKLLESRQGRCGEWADCFTLCCRALGFEARYVMDWTDHVWTEVYSASRSRWVHCDPCENVCDKPLLYEAGWGKKLTYVIAVSKEEVQDVTWRYSAKHSEVLARRKLCRESWLQRFIHQTWRGQLATLPGSRQSELWSRLICELTEFVCFKESGENLPGRSTGSLAWRAARGELGERQGLNINCSAQVGFVFKPTDSEKASGLIHIVYNSSTNKYVRKSNTNTEHPGWDACVFNHTNVLRKEELDWKKAYLARTEKSDSAEISWKVDVTGTNKKISKIELKAQSTVFETGIVNWRLCCGDNCFMEKAANLQQLKSIDVQSTSSLEITAVLIKGTGSNAWQHTQLFRQDISDKDSNPLEIKIYLS